MAFLRRCFSCCREESEVDLRACGNCKKRLYCSKECQKIDWKHGHKKWCCASGELHYDWEIRETGTEVGYGVYALRSFEVGEKIMVEKCVPGNIDEMSEYERAQLSKLAPKDSTNLFMKASTNKIALYGRSYSVICFNLSRANHRCTGVANSDHTYDDSVGVVVLICCKYIQPGEEITFSYSGWSTNNDFLQAKWGFRCSCASCTDEAKIAVLKQIEMLDQDIACPAFQASKRIKFCKKLLKLYDTLDIIAVSYIRTYYDLSNLYYALGETREAKVCLEKCQNLQREMLGEGTSDLRKYREKLERISSLG